MNCRFGRWGEEPKPRTPYKFVLAGTKLDDELQEIHSDEGGSEDEGNPESVDVPALQKQLKDRIRIERSLRSAKRKADAQVSELKKVRI